MSYSFNFTAETKAQAKQRVITELDQVVQQQPIHSTDREQAQSAAHAFIDLVPEPGADECIYVNVNGSVGWSGSQEAANVKSASVNVSASTSRKQQR